MHIQKVLDKKGGKIITLPFDLVIAEVAKVMSAESIGTAMLTDKDGRLAGIVSECDIVQSIARHGSQVMEIRVSAVMTQPAITCTPETTLDEALGLMSKHAIRHLPVVRNEQVVGLVNIRDVLNFQREKLIADVEKSKRNEQNLLVSQMRLEEQSRRLENTAKFLAEARDQAETANRAKTEFLATMSHELRTPLNAVIGFSEIMISELLGPVGSPEYREYAKDIHVSGQHLLALINDLLDLAKVESGRDELYEESIQVPELIRSIATLVRGRAQDACVEIEFEFEDDSPMLRVDERKLKQILANLLTNAIKFTESGGKVKIRSWSSLESGYVVQVVDTGIGIAPEDIPKALSQFGQVDSKLNRKYEGTGLGLPLTKALVELHGGSFDLQSEAGVGTTVTVRFPASRIEMSGQDQIYTGTDGRNVIGGLRG